MVLLFGGILNVLGARMTHDTQSGLDTMFSPCNFEWSSEKRAKRVICKKA